MSQSKVLQRACLWKHKALVNDAVWEAAVKNFGSVSVGCCFLMEMDKGCPELPVCDDSIFGEYLGTTVQDKDEAWESALKIRRESTSSPRCLQESLVEFVL